MIFHLKVVTSNKSVYTSFLKSIVSFKYICDGTASFTKHRSDSGSNSWVRYIFGLHNQFVTYNCLVIYVSARSYDWSILTKGA